MRKRLENPDDRAKIAEAFRRQFERRGEKGIFVSHIFGPMKPYSKKYIEEIAAEMNTTVDEALIKLFAAEENSPRVIYFSMNEEDVRYALKQPFVSVGSDASSVSDKQREENVAVHPRAYGTFPRVIGHYVREVKLFTLEEAVRKITSQAAARINLFDRGLLKPGMKADIVIFDPERVNDPSTFTDPHNFSVGIDDVIVNGVPVLRDGEMTRALPGRTIRGRGWKR